jgi:shikimate dehydrogenase
MAVRFAAKEETSMEISGRTRLLGLIGSPVEHSASPAMYNYCFEKYDLDCRYFAFSIPLEKARDSTCGRPT